MNQTAGATNAYRRCSKNGKVIKTYSEKLRFGLNALLFVPSGMVQLFRQHGAVIMDDYKLRKSFVDAVFSILDYCALEMLYILSRIQFVGCISLIKRKDVSGQFTSQLEGFVQDKPICVVHIAKGKKASFSKFFAAQLQDDNIVSHQRCFTKPVTHITRLLLLLLLLCVGWGGVRG